MTEKRLTFRDLLYIIGLIMAVVVNYFVNQNQVMERLSLIEQDLQHLRMYELQDVRDDYGVELEYIQRMTEEMNRKLDKYIEQNGHAKEETFWRDQRITDTVRIRPRSGYTQAGRSFKLADGTWIFVPHYTPSMISLIHDSITGNLFRIGEVLCKANERRLLNKLKPVERSNTAELLPVDVASLSEILIE